MLYEKTGYVASSEVTAEITENCTESIFLFLIPDSNLTSLKDTAYISHFPAAPDIHVLSLSL